MKVLKAVLFIAGILLISFGLYAVFYPEPALEAAPVRIETDSRFDNQVLGMVGIGILAILATVLIKKKP